MANFRFFLTLAIVLLGLMSQYGCASIDCDFESDKCAWVDDNVMEGQVSWVRTQTASIQASNPKSENAIIVPITAETAPVSMAYLKNTAGNVPGGQLHCLSFDYAQTDINIGWLTIWYYWLNDQGQFYNKQIWTNTAEEGTGQWQSVQVLVEGEGDWTIIAEVIINPFGVEIPITPGHGVALDNIKARPVARADDCSTPHVEPSTDAPTSTAAPATTPSPTTTTTVTTTPQAPTRPPTAAPSYANSVAVKLVEYKYTPNLEMCDAFQGRCDLRFIVVYHWKSNDGDHSYTQIVSELDDLDHVQFTHVPSKVLSRVKRGSVVTVTVDVKDVDTWWVIGELISDVAFFTFQFTVPQSSGQSSMKLREVGRAWFSDMEITFSTTL